MSEFKSFKKADLAKVAKKVGLPVRSKDTKQSLLEKIELFIEESPERAKSLAELDDDDEEEVVTLIEENDATEEEEEEEEDETVVKAAGDLLAEDEDDKDYNAPPPVHLKAMIVDPAIDFFEDSYAKVLAFTDRVGMTVTDYNDELRDTLSKTVTLNYLEAAVEVSYFLYFYLPLTPIKSNKSIHQVFRDNIPQLNTIKFPLPDVVALYDYKTISVFLNWGIFAVALPLLVSFYMNFSRRVVVIEDEDDDEDDVTFVIRVYKYDPVVFALAKVLIFYFVYKNGAFTSITSYAGIFHALRDLVLLQLGLYHTFVTYLGNFPLIVGIANVVIGLYSQFEDY